MGSKKKFQKQINQLEKSRSLLFSRLKNLPEEALLFRPDPKSWHMLDVAGHLFEAESLSFEYIQKKTMDPGALKKVGIKAFLRSLLLELFLRSPLKFKLPSSVIFKGVEPDLNRIGTQWDNLRGKLSVFCSEQPEEILNKGIFRHPRTGLHDFGQGIRFFQAHFDHHIRQINRIEKAWKIAKKTGQ